MTGKLAASLIALTAGTLFFAPAAGAFAISIGVAIDIPLDLGRTDAPAAADSVDTQGSVPVAPSADMKDHSASQKVERVLQDGAVVASAIVRAAVATVCMVICVGEAALDVIQEVFAFAGSGFLI